MYLLPENLIRFTSYLGIPASPEGSDADGKRAHLTSDLPLIGGGEHAVAQHDAPVNNHRPHVSGLHRVGKMGHRVVKRHEVVFVEINDHQVGPLFRLEGPNQVI